MKRGFEQFLQLAGDNAQVGNQLKAAADEKTFVDLALVLGRENGFEFSASDVRSALSALAPRSSELSEAELDAVAGGDGTTNLSAFAAYLASLGQGTGNG